jgi:hypothetical protein
MKLDDLQVELLAKAGFETMWANTPKERWMALAWEDLAPKGQEMWRVIMRTAFERLDLEGSCSGHVASTADGKVCARCGTHVDELRPEEFIDESEHHHA